MNILWIIAGACLVPAGAIFLLLVSPIIRKARRQRSRTDTGRTSSWQPRRIWPVARVLLVIAAVGGAIWLGVALFGLINREVTAAQRVISPPRNPNTVCPPERMEVVIRQDVWSPVVRIPMGKRINWQISEIDVPLESEINGDTEESILQYPVRSKNHLLLNYKGALREIRWRIPEKLAEEILTDTTIAHVCYEMVRY